MQTKEEKVKVGEQNVYFYKLLLFLCVVLSASSVDVYDSNPTLSNVSSRYKKIFATHFDVFTQGKASHVKLVTLTEASTD